MLNIYAIDKKLHEHEKEEYVQKRIEKWDKWRKANSQTWLQDYKQRVDRFVIDVDENADDYKDIIARDRENGFANLRKLDSDKFIGPPRFYFNSYKTEKERIAVFYYNNQQIGCYCKKFLYCE